MESLASSRLWREAFSPSDDRYRDERARLREAFMRFRANVALLANEISRDLPDYTVHDVTHLDALWELADLIAGPQIHLNPVEGLVLGGAFLLHDLGMGAAAHAEGLDVLRASDAWRKASAVVRNDPNVHAEDIDRATLGSVLRATHAQHAEALPVLKWRDSNTDSDYYLIEDQELRYILGPLMGRIAYSHWWPFERVRDELTRIHGAPASMPPDWTIDEFKIAALMRASDAAHIDARRAPPLLRLARGITGFSENHWRFQERLVRPTLQNGRLVYTAPRAFPKSEADAWWICYDTVNMIDHELVSIDRYLANRPGRTQFAARGVAGAQDPIGLSNAIATIDWIPVDAQPRIEDVFAVIGSLGGRELYGDNDLVPLRELIQNGIDAVRALGYVAPDLAELGRIRITKSAAGDQLAKYVVDDTGVGMSRTTIIHALLNFGTSLWSSSRVNFELPALSGRGFRPAGKYGIGFFSSFMLGDHIEVLTKRYDAAPQEAYFLEFKNGLRDRPLLSIAGSDHPRNITGTSVSIVGRSQLRNPSSYENPNPVTFTFPDLVRYLVPLAAIPIQCRDDVAGVVSMLPGLDLGEVEQEELAARCVAALTNQGIVSEYKPYVKNIRAIRGDDGRLIGRAALVRRPGYNQPAPGLIITEGGLRAETIGSWLGYFIGIPARAARDRAVVDISCDVLSRWAVEQSGLISEMSLHEYELFDFAADLHGVGVDVARFPIGFSEAGYLTPAELRAWAAERDAVIIIDEDEIMGYDEDTVVLGDEVIASTRANGSLAVRFPHCGSSSDSLGLIGLCIEVIFSAWGGNCRVERSDRAANKYLRVRFGERTLSHLPAISSSATQLRRLTT